VGNLPFSIDDDGFKKIFSGYDVSEFNLIRDNFSGKSKGFGFLTVEDESEAQKIISEFNGKKIEGRELTVNEARPMNTDRPKRSFNSGGSRHGGFNRRRF
jgi:RNA recognition motif-containing protein